MHYWLILIMFSNLLIAGNIDSFRMREFNKLTRDLNLSPETREAFHEYIAELGSMGAKHWWLKDPHLIPELLNQEQAKHTYFFGMISNPRNQDLFNLYDKSTEIIYFFYNRRTPEASDALFIWYYHMRKCFISLPVKWSAETKRRITIIANSSVVRGIFAILGVLAGQGAAYAGSRLTDGIVDSIVIN